MKLIACHIENFGCLSSEKVTFGEGLFVRNRPNGEGKSTLLAFLRAMLYGMESLSASDKRFKERLHYRPFGGGTYGGSLTITYQGEGYRIERTFDGKSATRDTLTVYDSHGAQTDALGDVPGLTVFGIDEDTFARTAFMTAEDIELSVPQSIGQRMCGFAFGASEENDFGSADGALEDACKELHSERKSRGVYTGEIPDAQRYLYEKQSELANLKRKEHALAEKQDALICEREALKLVREKLETIRKSETLSAQYEIYDDHLNRAKEAEETVARLTLQYPHGIPSAEELEEYRKADEALRHIDGAQSAYEQAELADKEKEESLRARFSIGVPSDEEMRAAETQLGELGEIDKRITQTAASLEVQAQDRHLLDRFDAEPLDAFTLSELRRQKQMLHSMKEERNALGATLAQSEGRTLDAVSIGAFVATAVLSMVGTVACVLLPLLGILLLALAALSAVIGVLRLTSLKKKAATESAARARHAQKLDDDFERAFAAYAAVLARYGYDDPALGLAFLEQDAKRYGELKEKEARLTEEFESLKKRKSSLEAMLLDFFTRYRTPIVEGMTQAYYELKRARGEHNFFLQRREKADQRIREHARQKERHAAFKVALLEKYALIEAGFSHELLATDRGKMEAAQQTLKTEREAAEKCRIEYKLPSERPLSIDGDAAMLDGEIGQRMQNVTALEREIGELEGDLEALGDTEAEIVRTEERLQSLEATHHCLQAAREELSLARRDLLDRYVEPIRQRYLSYAEKISKVLVCGMSMSAELSCQFEWHGALHGAAHLSAGEKSAMALCLRLALLDSMYEGEKPPLFLDDPFMALDEQHTESTLGILCELARDRQIVYLTCHDSRSPDTVKNPE